MPKKYCFDFGKVGVCPAAEKHLMPLFRWSPIRHSTCDEILLTSIIIINYK